MTISQATGTLFIVPTPIGNREDITLRALHILQSVDFILAEDTRHSLPLLQDLGIKKPLIALHAHNENTKTESLIEQLLQGFSMALISDAGTPLISDPGYPLVKSARDKAITVVPLPGPCALITALSGAGIPCDTFTFGGFLPAKTMARKKRLQSLSLLNETLVFYESTHRIKESIADIGNVFGDDCGLVLAKELTKSFERFVSGTVLDVKNWLAEKEVHTRGEFVLIIPPRAAKPETNKVQEILKILLKELPVKQAVKITALLTDENKNSIYKMALDVR